LTVIGISLAWLALTMLVWVARGFSQLILSKSLAEVDSVVQACAMPSENRDCRTLKRTAGQGP